MLNEIVGGMVPYYIVSLIGVLVAFGLTFVGNAKFGKFLPRDMGRAFAHDGTLSQGKPRGAGVIFISVFAVTGLLFGTLKLEYFIYIVLVMVEMFTGYFDDAAEKPWGELKKGILDFVIALFASLTFIHYNTTQINIATLGIHMNIHPVIFVILAIVLIWAAINVTNCSDGVDGLSGTLTVITLATIIVAGNLQGTLGTFSYQIVVFIACLLGYLWFNATPSLMLMGDAGSRAMGIFIAICVLKTQSPLLFLLVAIVLIVDGGLGLIKVALIRVCKIYILKNTKTPIHDHVRKTKGWSNTQTVFRFAIIQVMVSAVTIYLIMM